MCIVGSVNPPTVVPAGIVIGGTVCRRNTQRRQIEPVPTGIVIGGTVTDTQLRQVKRTYRDVGWCRCSWNRQRRTVNPGKSNAPTVMLAGVIAAGIGNDGTVNRQSNAPTVTLTRRRHRRNRQRQQGYRGQAERRNRDSRYFRDGSVESGLVLANYRLPWPTTVKVSCSCRPW